MIVYGRNPVREALRGKRDVERVWATEAAAAGEPWLAERGFSASDADEIERLCGSPEHQGCAPRPGRTPTPIPAGCWRPRTPWWSCLDEVQDPHNLGAVCRVAESAGAAGVVIPERRSAEVTPAVCKASAGAVEHLPVARVRNLADWLGEAKEREAWVYGAAAEGAVPYRRARLPGKGVVLVLGSEGRGLRPRVAGACDQLVRAAPAGEGRLAQRGHRRRGARVRNLALPRAWHLTGAHNVDILATR